MTVLIDAQHIASQRMPLTPIVKVLSIDQLVKRSSIAA
jgi:hypothetical protein